MTRRLYQFNEDFFYEETPELAYFLGYFMADGNIRNNKHEHVIRFGLNSVDKYILELFRDWISPDKPVMDYIGKSGYHISPMCNFSFHSKDVCQYLMDKYGINQDKTGNEVVLFKDNENLFHHFLHGFFDGDGYVSINKHNRARASICCMSENFLLDIRDILGFGNVLKTGIIFNIFMNNSYDVKLFKDKIYGDGFIGLTRKHDIFLSANFARFNTELHDTEVDFIKENCNKLTGKEIANILDRDKGFINDYTIENGWRDPLNQPWTEEENNVLLESRKNGLIYRDIQKLLPCRTQAAIEFQASILDIRDQKRPKISTDEQVQIVKLNPNMGYTELSKLSGLGRATIHRYRQKIKNGVI